MVRRLSDFGICLPLNKIPFSINKLPLLFQGSLGISPWDDWGSNEEPSEYLIFSSDGEDSDGEILVMPINDVDMPAIKKQFVTAEDALTATAHRVAMFGKRHKRHR